MSAASSSAIPLPGSRTLPERTAINTVIQGVAARSNEAGHAEYSPAAEAGEAAK